MLFLIFFFSGSASGVMESSDTVTRLQGESALVFQNSSPLASLLLSLKASLAALLQNYLDLGASWGGFFNQDGAKMGQDGPE